MRKAFIAAALASVVAASAAVSAHAQTLDEQERASVEAERARGEAERAREEAEFAREQVSREAERVREQASLEAALVQERASLEAQLRRARGELEQARAQLEAAARNVAVVTGPDRARSLDSVVVSRAPQPARAQLGAILVDAEGGALVTQVVPGGSAVEAGIRVGDLIQSIDGLDLASGGSAYPQLLARLDEVEPGDTVRLGVERRGERLDIELETSASVAFFTTVLQPFGNNVRVVEERIQALPGVVAPAPAVAASAARGFDIDRVFRFSSSPLWNMELVPITERLGRYFAAQEGLLVVRSPSDESIGIEDGDVILAIGARKPNSPEHAIRILSSFESGETIELSIMRDEQQRTVEYVMPEMSVEFAPAVPFAPAAPAAPFGQAEAP